MNSSTLTDVSRSQGGLARNGEDDEMELENGSDRGTSRREHG